MFSKTQEEKIFPPVPIMPFQGERNIISYIENASDLLESGRKEINKTNYTLRSWRNESKALSQPGRAGLFDFCSLSNFPGPAPRRHLPAHPPGAQRAHSHGAAFGGFPPPPSAVPSKLRLPVRLPPLQTGGLGCFVAPLP